MLTDPDMTASHVTDWGPVGLPQNPFVLLGWRWIGREPEKRKFRDNCSSSLRTESNALSLTWAVPDGTIKEWWQSRQRSQVPRSE